MNSLTNKIVPPTPALADHAPPLASEIYLVRCTYGHPGELDLPEDDPSNWKKHLDLDFAVIARLDGKLRLCRDSGSVQIEMTPVNRAAVLRSLRLFCFPGGNLQAGHMGALFLVSYDGEQYHLLGPEHRPHWLDRAEALRLVKKAEAQRL